MDLESKIREHITDALGPGGHPDAAHTLSRQLTDIYLDHFQEAVNWYQSEISFLTQDNEDLSVDLWLTREDILRQDVAKLNIKRRYKF